MGVNNVVLLEALEWFDETGRELLHRLPEEGSGEIKYGAQLTVRESQAAVLFYKGKAGDAFGPGRHTLKTGNIPIVTKILSAPWGLISPLRAEVFFVNLKVFADLRWGTLDPVAFRDAELGLVRLRAHGVFNIRIVQPVLLINTLAGTMGRYTTEQVEDYLRQVIVSRFNDYLGEHLRTLVRPAGALRRHRRRPETGPGSGFRPLRPGPGRALRDLHHPARGGAAGHRRPLAAERDQGHGQLRAHEGGHGHGKGGDRHGRGRSRPGAGAGHDDAGPVRQPAGCGRPGDAGAAAVQARCAECSNDIPAGARFCPFCGHEQLVSQQCDHCGANLPPEAAFCPRCGHPADEHPARGRLPRLPCDQPARRGLLQPVRRPARLSGGSAEPGCRGGR